MRKNVTLYAVPGLSDETRKKMHINRRTSKDILKAVAKEFGVTTTDILSPSRLRTVADARHIAIALHLLYVSKSISTVGQILKRHHASVINSRNRVAILLEVDVEFAEKYENIITELFAT